MELQAEAKYYCVDELADGSSDRCGRVDSYRQEREALWSHFELLEGRNDSFARDKEGADGTAGGGKVLLRGRAGGWNGAEPGKTGCRGVGCGADLQGALDHQPEGGAGLDHSQQYEACREAAYKQAQQQVQLHGCKRRQPFEEH